MTKRRWARLALWLIRAGLCAAVCAVWFCIGADAVREFAEEPMMVAGGLFGGVAAIIFVFVIALIYERLQRLAGERND